MEQTLVFERLKHRDITQKAAAKILNLSMRWIRKKAKRYNADGTDGF